MVSNAKIDREAKTLMKQTGVLLWLARKYVIENSDTAIVDEGHPLHVVEEKLVMKAQEDTMIALIAKDAKTLFNYPDNEGKPLFLHYPDLDPRKPERTQEYNNTILNLAIYYSEQDDWGKFVFLYDHYNFNYILESYSKNNVLYHKTLDAIVQHFIINNPTVESIQKIVYRIDGFIRHMWYKYAIDVWAAFAILNCPRQEIVSFFSTI